MNVIFACLRPLYLCFLTCKCTNLCMCLYGYTCIHVHIYAHVQEIHYSAVGWSGIMPLLHYLIFPSCLKLIFNPPTLITTRMLVPLVKHNSVRTSAEKHLVNQVWALNLITVSFVCVFCYQSLNNPTINQ